MTDARAGERGPAHLILVGLPGVGKTTVGRVVAERLGRAFIDLDDVITATAGATPSQIFATHGQAHFRALEHAATRDLRSVPPAVVAPGGGWILDPANTELLRPPSRLIYLKGSPETVVARMGQRIDDRPLLKGPNSRQKLNDLLAARDERYHTADFVIDTELLTLQEVIEEVIRLAPPAGVP